MRDTTVEEIHSHILSARYIVDLITTIASTGDVETLEEGTLCGAGITAMEHMDAAFNAVKTALNEQQEAQS